MLQAGAAGGCEDLGAVSLCNNQALLPLSLPSSASPRLISVPHLDILPQIFSFISFLCLADLVT